MRFIRPSLEYPELPLHSVLEDSAARWGEKTAVIHLGFREILDKGSPSLTPRNKTGTRIPILAGVAVAEGLRKLGFAAPMASSSTQKTGTSRSSRAGFSTNE